MAKKGKVLEFKKTGMKFVLFKDGGSIVCKPETAQEMSLNDADYVSERDASPKEVREYEKHQEFQKTAEKYMTLIEDWNADRPDGSHQFRYDHRDILNLIVMLTTRTIPNIRSKKKEVQVDGKELLAKMKDEKNDNSEKND